MRTILLFLSLLYTSYSLKIAVYNPLFAHSHIKFMATVADVLSEAGHNVTTIAPIFDPKEYKKQWKYGETIIVEQAPRVAPLINSMHDKNGMGSLVFTMTPSPMAMPRVIGGMTKMFAYQCESMIQNEDLLNKLKSQKFDIAIAESFEFCGHVIFERIGVKSIVTVGSAAMFEHMALLTGVPIIPSYVPGGMCSFSDEMTFFERAMNVFGTVVGNMLYVVMLRRQNQIAKDAFGHDFKDIEDIVSETPLFFTNSLPFLDFPHPILHKVKEIGGINVPKAKKVDKTWDEILNRKSKTVLISFGSVAKSKNMPIHLKKNVIESVKRFPEVQFIWKYEDDDLTNLPDNLILSKWTPQPDLLADPRLSVFLTHGGHGSAIEIAYSGIPALAVPLFGDHMRNSKALVKRGVAITISKYEFAEQEKLCAALKELLENESYKKNAQKLASLVSNTPFTPKEILVKNIEFIGRFGNLPQLDPYGRHLSFITYYLLDVIATVAVAILIIFFTTFFVLKKLLCLCKKAGKSKKE